MSFITIDGFEQLTEQQLFDIAAAHILKTGKKSIGNLGCVYGGSGCAASVFLTADGRMLGDTIGSWRQLLSADLVPAKHAALMAAVQDAHDGASDDHFMNSWLHNMEKIAEEHKLNPAILHQEEEIAVL